MATSLAFHSCTIRFQMTTKVRLLQLLCDRWFRVIHGRIVRSISISSGSDETFSVLRGCDSKAIFRHPRRNTRISRLKRRRSTRTDPIKHVQSWNIDDAPIGNLLPVSLWAYFPCPLHDDALLSRSSRSLNDARRNSFTPETRSNFRLSDSRIYRNASSLLHGIIFSLLRTLEVRSLFLNDLGARLRRHKIRCGQDDSLKRKSVTKISLVDVRDKSETRCSDRL